MSFQDRAQHQIAQIDKELSKYPVLNNLERQTSVPKVYAFLGLVGVYVFLVFFNIAGEFLVNLAGFLIPAYYSLDGLFTTTRSDNTQYWVVYAFLTVVESAISAAYWFRMARNTFYYFFKFVFIMWMALPQTRGAHIVFGSFIQPVFSRYFQSGSTSSNLRSQANQATKEHST
ncbi:protein yop-1 [Uncinocarpus reesii 1704]|uniref:Protein YOP1 n=1 Tax=Uncinocarpus reesii (strain UAMH 1704) TaxID=336963 RepID=C4JNQ9_UNCRE|nr:protein yop-1 [Uncinocarpus reesii 1704]EEP79533.1 protein yop-1 [Uncinocarpus reesii 1704]